MTMPPFRLCAGSTSTGSGLRAGAREPTAGLLPDAAILDRHAGAVNREER